MTAIPHPGILGIRERQNLEFATRNPMRILYFDFTYKNKSKKITTLPPDTIVLPYTGVVVEESFMANGYLNIGTEQSPDCFGKSFLRDTGWQAINYTTGSAIYKKLIRPINLIISITTLVSALPLTIGSGWCIFQYLNLNEVQKVG